MKPKDFYHYTNTNFVIFPATKFSNLTTSDLKILTLRGVNQHLFVISLNEKTLFKTKFLFFLIYLKQQYEGYSWVKATLRYYGWQTRGKSLVSLWYFCILSFSITPTGLVFLIHVLK